MARTGMESTFAAELRRLRVDEARISAKKLAERAGIARSRIYGLEAGDTPRPYTDTVVKLARGLATDNDGDVDELRAAEYFGTLISAMGGGPQPTVSLSEDAETRIGPGPTKYRFRVARWVATLESLPPDISERTAVAIEAVISALGRPPK